MARNYWENEAVFKDNEFEIDCLNEQLLELLKTPISKLIQNNTHLQSLSDINSSLNKPEDNNHQLANYSESPPGLYPYKNDYSLFHQHGSPVKPQLLQHYLSPIGVFWDIENCRVPKGKSASTVVQAIRDKFFKGYREAEFIVVCDVYKESRQIIQELNDAQVYLIFIYLLYCYK